MIKSNQHAFDVQARRKALGKAGVAKAVRRYLKGTGQTAEGMAHNVRLGRKVTAEDAQ